MLDKMDSFILNKVCQPISDYAYINYGISCFRIAWWFLGLTLVGYLFTIAKSLGLVVGSETNYITVAFAVCIGPVFIYMLSKRIIEVQKDAEKHDSDSGSTIRFSSGKILQGGFRFVFLIIPVLFFVSDLQTKDNVFYSILSNMSLFCWGIADYFASCIPLPPGSRRSKESKARQMQYAAK